MVLNILGHLKLTFNTSTLYHFQARLNQETSFQVVEHILTNSYISVELVKACVVMDMFKTFNKIRKICSPAVKERGA